MCLTTSIFRVDIINHWLASDRKTSELGLPICGLLTLNSVQQIDSGKPE